MNVVCPMTIDIFLKKTSSSSTKAPRIVEVVEKPYEPEEHYVCSEKVRAFYVWQRNCTHEISTMKTPKKNNKLPVKMPMCLRENSQGSTIRWIAIIGNDRG